MKRVFYAIQLAAIINASIVYAQEKVRAAWVRQWGSGTMTSNDRATDVAVDDSGNVYIAGETSSGFTGADYLTVKYNSAGRLIWAAQYNGANLMNRDDQAVAIAVDPAGNVYVTGNSKGQNSNSDFATVKYNSAGKQLWIARYTEPGDSYDYVIDMAVDARGNVYITGGSVFAPKYITLKYSPAGEQLWIVKEPLNQNESVSCLTVDAAGNVYVSGYGFLTVKYNAGGVKQWAVRYGSTFGIAKSIAADANGNVFLAGAMIASETNTNTVIIKYTAIGALQWIISLPGPRESPDREVDLAVDDRGNVYITSASYGANSDDMLTLKYNGAGVEQWVARYDGPGQYVDTPIDLAVDPAGNVFVAGTSASRTASPPNTEYVTLRYDASGREQWVARHSGSINGRNAAAALAIDQTGNAYVTGQSGEDCVTIKYNLAGVAQWDARYDGAKNSDDRAAVLAVDAAGNVYVTGASRGPATERDYATIKYDAAGNQQWLARYAGPAKSEDLASAILANEAGEVYVAGTSGSANVLVKYGQAGAQQWIASLNQQRDIWDRKQTRLAFDQRGNIVMFGGITDNIHAPVALSLKTFFVSASYNRNGAQQWAAYKTGLGLIGDKKTAAIIDKPGNLYVAGLRQGDNASTFNTVVKYNAGGQEMWAAPFTGPNGEGAYPNSLAVDDSGNVYAAGKSAGFVTIKYNAAGRQQWLAQYGDAGSFNEPELGPVAVARDHAGFIYVAGTNRLAWNQTDYIIIKYDPATGNAVWVRRYNKSNYDYAKAMTLDTNGNIYVTGRCHDVTTGFDYVTVKYNTAGEQLWTARYNHPANLIDTPADIAVDAAGNVYISGSSSDSDDEHFAVSVYTTIKYAQVPNQAPAITSTPDTLAALNQLYQYQMIATDADGDSLRYALLQAPDWLKLDTKTGLLQGKPANNDLGVTLVILQVSDDGEAKQQQMYKLHAIPGSYSLSQNHPNPFNPSTTIPYALAEAGHVMLKVFNLRGQEVATLVNENKLAGEYAVKWNPQNIPSGVYVYRLQAGEFTGTKKLILLK